MNLNRVTSIPMKGLREVRAYVIRAKKSVLVGAALSRFKPISFGSNDMPMLISDINSQKYLGIKRMLITEQPKPEMPARPGLMFTEDHHVVITSGDYTKPFMNQRPVNYSKRDLFWIGAGKIGAQIIDAIKSILNNPDVIYMNYRPY